MVKWSAMLRRLADRMSQWSYLFAPRKMALVKVPVYDQVNRTSRRQGHSR